MAKKQGMVAQVVEKTQDTAAAAEEKMEAFAEDLGRLLGAARGKAEGWLGQRTTIAKHLEELRDTASELLSQLGHRAEAAIGRTPERAARSRAAGRGLNRSSGATKQRVKGIIFVGGKRTRVMSPEARQRISAAQKARWASLRATQKK